MVTLQHYSNTSIDTSVKTYLVCVRDTKCGPVHMKTFQKDGRYFHSVASNSHPHIRYTVTVDRHAQSGVCNCPATARCWHIVAAIKAENAVNLWLWEIARDMIYTKCTEFYCEALDLKTRIESGTLEVQA